MNRLALAAALLLAAAPASADTIARGAIVKIEERELYLNLGRVHGVERGARLRLKRPIKLRHPVTKAWVSDWVPIGSATVTAPGERLSMAVVDADLAAQARSGDIAEVYVERDEPIAPPVAAAESDAPMPTLDPVAARVLAMWSETAALSIDERIAAWERFLSVEPDGPHVAPLREDVALLRELREAMRPPEEAAQSPALGGLEHAPPRRADDGAAVPLAFLVDDPERLATSWLHYRTVGQPTYQRILLRREGDVYLRGAIPAEAVRAPGVEYFVEIARTSGEVGAAIGSPEQPIAVGVAGESVKRRFGDGAGRSQIALRSSYTDFATLDRRAGDRTDRFAVFEADVLYRVDREVTGVRVGFGSVQGEGGFADAVYTDEAPPPTVGFNYGYAELEVAMGRTVGAALRFTAGVGQEGFGAGLEGRLRLGRTDETNLSFLASRVSEIGFLSEARLEVQTVGRLAVGLSGGVTDLPSNGDLGVRLAADLGWRVVPWLTPTLRVSYQARTVDHDGLGAGLGVVFGW